MGKIKLEIPLEELAKTITQLPPKEQKELWSLLATFEELSDKGALAALKESEEDVKRGSSIAARRSSGKLSDAPAETRRTGKESGVPSHVAAHGFRRLRLLGKPLVVYNKVNLGTWNGYTRCPCTGGTI